MFIVIGLMLTGMLTGFLLRHHRLSFIHTIITVLIWLLLFLLGMEAGSNQNIINGLHALGLEAIILTLGGTLGSVMASWILWRMINKKGRNENQISLGDAPKNNNLFLALKDSLVIIIFFILGVLSGLTGLLPQHPDSHISFYALCALMASVGISIGNDSQTLQNFRTLNPRLTFLPLATITGTLTGCVIVSLLLPHRSLTDCLAIGSGFGYYSLSSIFITEYRGAEMGTIALLANIGREILTLLAAPLFVRRFGPLAPISAGGATTMDTTLPIITQTSGSKFVIVSLFHGFIVDFSVPFLVTLFCSL